MNPLFQKKLFNAHNQMYQMRFGDANASLLEKSELFILKKEEAVNKFILTRIKIQQKTLKHFKGERHNKSERKF